jgi:hypothetical protein
MPWSSKITRAFSTGEEGPDIVVHKNLPYGAYNQLLYTLFPVDSDFIVSPDFTPGHIGVSADFIISFQVTLHPGWLPVLILDARPSQDWWFHSRREAADRQISQHLVDLSGVLPIVLS